MNTLHVYGQEAWHSDVYIVGTHQSLKELWLAIGELLHSGSKEHSKADFFVNDEEGYALRVFRLSEEEMKKACTPYTEEMACDSEENMLRTLGTLLQKLVDSKK